MKIDHRNIKRWSAAVLTGWLLFVVAIRTEAMFRLANPGSEVYYTLAVVAGEEVQLTGAARIEGAVHSNGDLDLKNQSSIDGDVTVVGSQTGGGTITGTVAEGAPPVVLPTLDEAALRALADRTLVGDVTLTDETLTDVLLVEGSVTVKGTFEGTGTLIATGDVQLAAVGNNAPPLPTDTQLSVISLGSVQLLPRRALRGIVYGAVDVQLNPDARVEGVVVAGRQATLLNGATVTFVDFDVTAPTIVLVEPGEGSLLGIATPSIEIAFSDDLSGVDPTTVQFLLDGVDQTESAEVTAEGLLFTPTAPLVDGEHLLEVTVFDVSANVAHATFIFSTDTTAPLLTIVSPVGTIQGDPTPTVQVNYGDALAGVDLASLQIAIDGVPLSDCQVAAGSATCESPPLTDGTHVLAAQIADLVGNTATATGTFEIILDQEPPTVQVVAPTGVLVNQRTPEIVLALADDASGINSASLQVRINGVVVTGCAVTTDSATCTPSPLQEGTHRVTVQVADNVGNLGFGQGVFSLEVDEDGPLVEILSPAAAPVTEGRVPGITVVFGDLESGLDLPTLQIALDGAPLTASCTVTRDGATCPLVPEPAVGSHTVTVSLVDTLGNVGSAAVTFTVQADTRPPRLELLAPLEAVIVGNATPEIRLGYRDSDTGVDPATFTVAVDGVDLTAECTVGAAEAVCTPPPLATGARTLTASIADQRGNLRQFATTFEIDLRLPIEIFTPANGLLTRESVVEVTGTVSPLAEAVSVAGVEAVVQDGTFVAEGVPLAEGGNTLTAVARNGDGALGTATVSVVRDTEPPLLTILTPPDGFVTTTSQIFVTGEYNDRVSSNTEMAAATVFVNGTAAVVEQRSFLVEDFLLQPGENRLVAEVTDAAGNTASTEVTVTLATGNTLQIEELQGNFQQGIVEETLPQPLVVRLRDGLGMPLPGRLVTFTVSRGTGAVSVAGEQGRVVSVLSDELGMARVDFQLGERAGKGNHEVTVSSVGFPGQVLFCASATFGPPQRIVSIVGDNNTGAMSGAVGQRYPKPLLTQVFDGSGNPLPDVEVTYAVVLGDGTLEDEASGSTPGPEVTVTTDGQGIAGATFVVGPEAGFNNQVVTGRFEGLDGVPAIFTLSAFEPGDPADTAVVGIVLDNEDAPVPGVTIHIDGTALSAVTALDGRFRIDGVPVGTVHLGVDGTTTTRPGFWPHLNFEFTTFPGQENDLGMPIRLLPLDEAGSAIVGGDQDVTLTLDGVAGAELTVFANSVTFPDGSNVGRVSFTQVHADKVPMVAPLGSGFMLAVTIQPPGTLFDPPARLAIPNMGDAPGTVVDIFSFDHDLGEFVTSGTATVSADGRQLVSNPGFGVSKAGWHGCVPPVPTTNPCNGGACTVCTPQGPKSACGECRKCTGGGCQPRQIKGVTATARGAGDSGSALVTGNHQSLPAANTAEDEEDLIVGVDQDVEFEATKTLGDCQSGKLKYNWTFGDGKSAEGQNVTHVYEAPGNYTARVVVSCEGCPDAGTKDDTIQVQAIKIDLRYKNLAEEKDPAPNEEDPGGIIGLNSDDDDDDEVRDLEDDNVFGDDDLQVLRIEIQSGLKEGKVTLDLDSGSGQLKAFDDKSKSMEFEFPHTWELDSETVPGVVWIEGTEKSTAERDVVVKITYENDRGGMIEDLVKLTVIELDLDIDSSNDEGFLPPARNDDDEDLFEDSRKGRSRPGKMIMANINDDDKDFIPDFADGFNRDPAEMKDDVNDEEMFVPIVLEIPSFVDLNDLKIRLTYDEADPTGVTRTLVPQDPMAITIPRFDPGSGSLRLWTENGNVARNSASVKNGGHYIPPGTYDAADLGFSGGKRECIFFVEGVGGSDLAGDQRILVEVDPDGSGPMDFVLKDAVRVTVVLLEVFDEREDRIIYGGDMAFISAVDLPEMPRLVATIYPALDEPVFECIMEFEFDRSPGDNVNGVPDSVRVPVPRPSFPLASLFPWRIHSEFVLLNPERKAVFGGDGYVECLSSTLDARHDFRIRGRNPIDPWARAVVNNRFPGSRDFAYAMVKHESRIPGFGTERYHQFELRRGSLGRSDTLYTPLLGPPDGWGIFQVDLTRSRDTNPMDFVTVDELWGFDDLLIRAAPILREKLDIGDDWLNAHERVRWNGTACVQDAAGNYRPHGQRAQSGIDANGGTWAADLTATGGRCTALTPGDWVGAAPALVAIPDRSVSNCLFSDAGTASTTQQTLSFEVAAGIKCYNGCGNHYVFWNGSAWDFNTAPNNYVEEVCDEVEP